MTLTAKEAIDNIKEAETKAGAIIKDAEDQAHKIVLDAKLDAKEEINWAEDEAHAEARRISERTKEAIGKELEKITKDTQKEKEELENKAAANIARAVDFIKDQLFKLYGHSEA